MAAQSIPPTQNWKTLNGLSNIIRSFSINEDLVPAITLTYSLGTSLLRWLNLHVQNIFATNADIGNIDCTTLSATGTVTMTGLSATNITASGILAGNSLSITTNGTINGNLTVGNDLYVTGSFDVGAFSCTSMVCTGSATFGASITATSISSTGSISGQAFSCTALTCSGAVSAATISAPTLTITGNTAMGGTTPALVTSAGLVTVQNATDISLVNTNASITTAGGIYVAKSIRCIATVTAATYNGSGGISTSSNSLGFTQGTGVPTTASINYFSSTTEITGLLTCTGGITVSSGTTTLGGTTPALVTSAGLVTVQNATDVSLVNTNASITTAGGIYVAKSIRCIATVTAATYNGSGAITTSSNSLGFTQGTGVPTTASINYFSSTTEITGLLTCRGGITVSSGTTTLGGTTPMTVSSVGAVTVQNLLTINSGGVAGTTNTGIRIDGDSSTTRTTWDQRNEAAPSIYNVFSGDLTLQSYWGLSVNLNSGAVNPSFNAPQTRIANTSSFTVNRRAVGAASGVYDTIFSVNGISGLTSAGAITASGLVTCNAGLTVAAGTTTLGATTPMTVSSTGVVTIQNTFTIGASTPVIFSGTGVLTVQNTSSTISSSTGALRVTGGVGCAGSGFFTRGIMSGLGTKLITGGSSALIRVFDGTNYFICPGVHIIREGLVADTIDVLDEAVDIAAVYPGCFHFLIFNNTSYLLSINRGTGTQFVSSAGVGTIVNIPAATFRIFFVNENSTIMYVV